MSKRQQHVSELEWCGPEGQCPLVPGTVTAGRRFKAGELDVNTETTLRAQGWLRDAVPTAKEDES